MITIERVDTIIKGLIKQDIRYDKSPDGIYYIENHNPKIVGPGDGAFQLNSPGILKLRTQKSTYCDRVLIDLTEGDKAVYQATALMRQKAKEYLDSLGLTDLNIVLNYEFQMPGYFETFCRQNSESHTKVELRYYLEVF